MPRPGSKKTGRNGATNGLIAGSVRLACALRYFAGGDPSDIGAVYVIGNTDVYNSVWIVVDFVNA